MVRKKVKVVDQSWSGELGVQRAAELRQELLQALERADRLQVDLSGATTIDAACLQLLCSGHRTATSRNKEMVLGGLEVLQPVLRDAGFLRHMGCALDCTGSCIWTPAGQIGKEGG